MDIVFIMYSRNSLNYLKNHIHLFYNYYKLYRCITKFKNQSDREDVKVDAATYIVIGHSIISHISFIRDLASFWLLLALTVGIQLIIRVHKYEMKLIFSSLEAY